ncbi:MAG: hypothetical protein RLY95_1689 [Pseudomonadota bacterium]|jgi:hypothetical protein
MKLLLVIYAALLVDLLTGLQLNLYGWGREPLYFALAVVAASSLAYRIEGARLGMIALVLCCAWLVFYPAKNGFDVVLSPTLTLSIILWLWQKFKKKP